MFLRRLLCIWITISFLATLVIPPQKVYAQTILDLPEPGTMVALSCAYTPVLIKGLKINPANPLALDFIVATGNSKLTAQDPELKKESEKLIKYFFAALTLPENEVWVNLSPYEKDRIVPKATGETEMGRDMLAQDYILKQITASLIYPEKGLGKEFWNKVYAQASERFGTSQVPVNTFNKVWIVADKASVYEAKDTVLVVDSHLKVMLEEDYIALEKHMSVRNGTDSIGANIVREIVLPALEKEVNEGKNFANLRQIFHSLILAKWYKETLKSALLNQVYSNRSKINGLSPTRGHVPEGAVSPSGLPSDLAMNVKAEPNDVEYIYQQYLKAYKKGVFNYIKEDIDQTSKQPMPRKYFSGGVSAEMNLTEASPAMAAQGLADKNNGKFLDIASQAMISDTNASANAQIAGSAEQDIEIVLEKIKQRVTQNYQVLTEDELRSWGLDRPGSKVSLRQVGVQQILGDIKSVSKVIWGWERAQAGIVLSSYAASRAAHSRNPRCYEISLNGEKIVVLFSDAAMTVRATTAKSIAQLVLENSIIRFNTSQEQEQAAYRAWRAAGSDIANKGGYNTALGKLKEVRTEVLKAARVAYVLGSELPGAVKDRVQWILGTGAGEDINTVAKSVRYRMKGGNVESIEINAYDSHKSVSIKPLTESSQIWGDFIESLPIGERIKLSVADAGYIFDRELDNVTGMPNAAMTVGDKVLTMFRVVSGQKISSDAIRAWAQKYESEGYKAQYSEQYPQLQRILEDGLDLFNKKDEESQLKAIKKATNILIAVADALDISNKVDEKQLSEAKKDFQGKVSESYHKTLEDGKLNAYLNLQAASFIGGLKIERDIPFMATLQKYREEFGFGDDSRKAGAFLLLVVDAQLPAVEQQEQVQIPLEPQQAQAPEATEPLTSKAVVGGNIIMPSRNLVLLAKDLTSNQAMIVGPAIEEQDPELVSREITLVTRLARKHFIKTGKSIAKLEDFLVLGGNIKEYAQEIQFLLNQNEQLKLKPSQDVVPILLALWATAHWANKEHKEADFEQGILKFLTGKISLSEASEIVANSMNLGVEEAGIPQGIMDYVQYIYTSDAAMMGASQNNPRIRAAGRDYIAIIKQGADEALKEHVLGTGSLTETISRVFENYPDADKEILVQKTGLPVEATLQQTIRAVEIYFERLEKDSLLEPLKKKATNAVFRGSGKADAGLFDKNQINELLQSSTANPESQGAVSNQSLTQISETEKTLKTLEKIGNKKGLKFVLNDTGDGSVYFSVNGKWGNEFVGFYYKKDEGSLIYTEADVDFTEEVKGTFQGVVINKEDNKVTGWVSDYQMSLISRLFSSDDEKAYIKTVPRLYYFLPVELDAAMAVAIPSKMPPLDSYVIKRVADKILEWLALPENRIDSNFEITLKKEIARNFIEESAGASRLKSGTALEIAMAVVYAYFNRLHKKVVGNESNVLAVKIRNAQVSKLHKTDITAGLILDVQNGILRDNRNEIISLISSFKEIEVTPASPAAETPEAFSETITPAQTFFEALAAHFKISKETRSIRLKFGGVESEFQLKPTGNVYYIDHSRKYDLGDRIEQIETDTHGKLIGTKNVGEEMKPAPGQEKYYEIVHDQSPQAYITLPIKDAAMVVGTGTLTSNASVAAEPIKIGETLELVFRIPKKEGEETIRITRTAKDRVKFDDGKNEDGIDKEYSVDESKAIYWGEKKEANDFASVRLNYEGKIKIVKKSKFKIARYELTNPNQPDIESANITSEVIAPVANTSPLKPVEPVAPGSAKEIKGQTGPVPFSQDTVEGRKKRLLRTLGRPAVPDVRELSEVEKRAAAILASIPDGKLLNKKFEKLTNQGADAAMNNGGIDLNASKIVMTKTGSGIEIKFDPAMIAQFKAGNFDGIVPVITEITPIVSIYAMLGLKE